jgi:transcription initiation factor TFIIA large subunit
MSNANVGAVYQQVIRDVVESTRVDFDEAGVDESVLEELARVSSRFQRSSSSSMFHLFKSA